MEKKGNKTIIGILVVIIIILLVLIGLIYTGTINITKNKVNSNKQQISNNSEISKMGAKVLITKYMYDINYYHNQPQDVKKLLENGLTDNFKAFITIMNSTDELEEAQTEGRELDCLKAFPNVKYEEVSYGNNKAYEFVFGKESYEKITCGLGDNYIGQYDYDKLNKTYKYLFGNESDLPKTHISRALDFYAYSEYYNSYVVLKRYGGGPYYLYQYYDISNISEKNNSLEINIKFLEFDLTNNKNITYESKSGKKYEYTNEELYGNGFDGENVENALKEIYNKEYDYLNEYKFIFGKSDSHYYLKSINKVN